MSKIGADIAVENWLFEFWPYLRFSLLPYPLPNNIKMPVTMIGVFKRTKCDDNLALMTLE